MLQYEIAVEEFVEALKSFIVFKWIILTRATNWEQCHQVKWKKTNRWRKVYRFWWRALSFWIMLSYSYTTHRCIFKMLALMMFSIKSSVNFVEIIKLLNWVCYVYIWNKNETIKSTTWKSKIFENWGWTMSWNSLCIALFFPFDCQSQWIWGTC